MAVYTASGSDSDYANEAMEEVDLSDAQWGTHARYTVYRIADSAKSAMWDSEVPTFQKQVHAAGDWVALTPSEIWYGVGYIVVATALNNDDLVRCATGHYRAISLLFGCSSRTYSSKVVMQDCTCYGDTATQRYPTVDDWDGSLEAFYTACRATLTTTGGLANSHIKLTHLAGGAAGNDINFAIGAPSGGGAIVVTVATNDISVAVPTGATALQVINALRASADVAALGVAVEIPPTENGSAVVAEYAHTHLAGGLGELTFSDLLGIRMLFKFYMDYPNKEEYVGFGYVTDLVHSGGPAELHKYSLTVTGSGYPMCHVVN